MDFEAERLPNLTLIGCDNGENWRTASAGDPNHEIRYTNPKTVKPEKLSYHYCGVVPKCTARKNVEPVN